MSQISIAGDAPYNLAYRLSPVQGIYPSLQLQLIKATYTERMAPPMNYIIVGYHAEPSLIWDGKVRDVQLVHLYSTSTGDGVSFRDASFQKWLLPFHRPYGSPYLDPSCVSAGISGRHFLVDQNAHSPSYACVPPTRPNFCSHLRHTDLP